MGLFKKAKQILSQPVVNEQPPEEALLAIKRQYSFVQAKSFKGCKRFKLSTSYNRLEVEKNQDRFRKEGFNFTGKRIDVACVQLAVRDEAMVVYVDGLQIGARSFCDKEAEVYKAMKDGRIDQAYVRIEDTEYGTGTYIFLHWKESE